MTPLPRGTCPVCFAEVALRKGDLVREHSVGSFEATREEFERMTRVPVCPGSGKPSVEGAGQERRPEIGDPVVVDGVKYRIKSIYPGGRVRLFDRFAPRARQELYIDLAQITRYDRVAGVWRVVP